MMGDRCQVKHNISFARNIKALYHANDDNYDKRQQEQEKQCYLSGVFMVLGGYS